MQCNFFYPNGSNIGEIWRKNISSHTRRKIIRIQFQRNRSNSIYLQHQGKISTPMLSLQTFLLTCDTVTCNYFCNIFATRQVGFTYIHGLLAYFVFMKRVRKANGIFQHYTQNLVSFYCMQVVTIDVKFLSSGLCYTHFLLKLGISILDNDAYVNSGSLLTSNSHVCVLYNVYN